MKSYHYRNNTSLWLLLQLWLWSRTSWSGEIKQLHKPWNYGAHAFYVFSQFLKIWNHHFQKTTCQVMPLTFSLKRPPKGLRLSHLARKWESNFKEAPKLRIFLLRGPSRNDYNAFRCDGYCFPLWGCMGIYAIKLSVEVSAVLRSEWTKYFPMLSVCDLLVTFHWRWVYYHLRG